MLYDLFHNITLIAALAAWMMAQFIKLAVYIIKERKFDFGFMLRLGGMPSSHSSSSAACATSVGLLVGFDSAVFAVACGMMVLIMVDAQSVRYAAGQQAKLLNQMADEFYRDRKFSPEKLVEFLGHTRVEVIAGFFLGVFTALVTHRLLAGWVA